MAIVMSNLENISEEAIKKLNCSDKGFFCSFGWYKNFIDTVVSKANDEYYFIYEESQVGFVFPILFSKDRFVRKIKSLANYYSPIYSVVNGSDIQCGLNIARFLREIKNGLLAWDLIDLRPMDVDEAEYLLGQLKLAGMPAKSYFCFGNWVLEVQGRSFDQYFKGLSSKVRNTVLRKSKKFFNMDGAHVEIIRFEEDLGRGFDAYNSVYQSSWKVTEPFPEFIPGLMRLAVDCGGLRLGVAYLDGKPIASQLWIVSGGAAYIFKLAYDEAFKNLSVGSILTKTLMQHVIDVDKVGVVDYLCGDDDYKSDWMSTRRERVGIQVFNMSTFQGVALFFIDAFKSVIKSVYRR